MSKALAHLIRCSKAVKEIGHGQGKGGEGKAEKKKPFITEEENYFYKVVHLFIKYCLK